MTHDFPFSVFYIKAKKVLKNLQKKEFENFLEKNINEKKTEFLLPFAVNLRIAKEGKNVKVLPTSEKWYGMTYADDTPTVRAALTKMINDGLYDMGQKA